MCPPGLFSSGHPSPQLSCIEVQEVGAWQERVHGPATTQGVGASQRKCLSKSTQWPPRLGRLASSLFGERRGRSDGQERALEPENTPDADERGEDALQCHLPGVERDDELTRCADTVQL